MARNRRTPIGRHCSPNDERLPKEANAEHFQPAGRATRLVAEGSLDRHVGRTLPLPPALALPPLLLHRRRRVEPILPTLRARRGADEPLLADKLAAALRAAKDRTRPMLRLVPRHHRGLVAQLAPRLPTGRLVPVA